MATIIWRGVVVCLLLGAGCVGALGQEVPGLPPGFLPATTVQLPSFGISIDAEGTLDARTFKDFDGKLLAERIAAAKGAKPGELWSVAKLRKVSLVRLEGELKAAKSAGREPGDVVRNLAGLTRLQLVFCYPASADKPGDIVIAGPAEPFARDAAGRAIGLRTGRPVLQLDDLGTALRAFRPGEGGWPLLGCTIDPPAAGLAKLVEFQKTVPRSIREEQRPAVAEAIARGV